MGAPGPRLPLSPSQQVADEALEPLKMAQAAAWLLDQLGSTTRIPGVCSSDDYPPEAELRTYLTHMSVETLVKELATVRRSLAAAAAGEGT